MNTSTRNAWLRCLRPLQNPELRLICFHHSGGNPVLFQPWASLLPEGIEMHTVLLPGRGLRLREAPYEHITPLLADLIPVLRPLLQEMPFAFFGHSLGALLAYELTHMLSDEGLQPVALFASACHAPQLLPTGERLHVMSRPELLKALARIEGTPPELFAEEELMELILPVLRADMAVYETYVYQARDPLSCPLIACGGRQDTRVATWQLEAWREQAGGPFEFHLFPGGHFYLNEVRPQLMALLERVLAP